MDKQPFFRLWLQKADDDYGHASLSLDDPKNVFYSLILFHFHQAAEKYLKAYIVKHDLEFKKIHDLIKLLEIVKGKDEEFSEIEEEVRLLNNFYIDTRYPVYWPTGYDEKLAQKAKKSARKVGDFVKRKIISNPP